MTDDIGVTNAFLLTNLAILLKANAIFNMKIQELFATESD
jgi:hypothetical protein